MKNILKKNTAKAYGRKHGVNVLAEIRNQRVINESPQSIQPLDTALIEKVKGWILKIHNGLGENGVKFKIHKVYGIDVYQLDRIIIPGYSGRKNILYSVLNDEINFFSLYEIKTNLKGIKSAVTQFLVYRNQDNNKNGISSITLNRVSWKLVFPMTNSFLCDKQQTEFGRKSWEFIVEQSFEKGLKVYVYDSTFATLTEFSSYEDYMKNISKYYGTTKDFQRYQVLIRKEE